MKQVSKWWKAQTAAGGSPCLVVESWLGAEKLATLPVVAKSWRLEDDAESKTPGRVTFQVPNTAEWRPRSHDHPLACFGQQLHVSIGLQQPNTTIIETVPVGVYRLDSPDISGETITVTGRGLLTLVEDSRLLAPISPAQVTRSALVTQLLQGIIPVSIQVHDCDAPACTEESDRFGLLLDVLESWPAQIRIDANGVGVVSPPWDDHNSGEPLTTITDEMIVMDSLVLDQLEPGPNAYRVSSIPEGATAAMHAIATIDDGPMRWGGPYGYRVATYSSPLLQGDQAVLSSVARAMCERSRRRTFAYRVKIIPTYDVEIGDVIAIRSDSSGVFTVGRVINLRHTSASSELKIAALGEAM